MYFLYKICFLNIIFLNISKHELLLKWQSELLRSTALSTEATEQPGGFVARN